jgi:ADP-ribose pyrophosphatase YjhB (NUDIX family)
MNEDSRGDRRPGPSVETVPDGDNRTRLVCPDCGYVEYKNPKIIVGAVCVWEDRFLLCRRAINPRKGLWTMPAGFMELGETTAEGAKREVREEAGADVEILGLIGIYEIPRISQVYVIHHARMLAPSFESGAESAEVSLFAWDRIPWEQLAFPSVTWALRQFRAGARSTVQIAQL